MDSASDSAVAWRSNGEPLYRAFRRARAGVLLISGWIEGQLM
jgi:hypothetical protein